MFLSVKMSKNHKIKKKKGVLTLDSLLIENSLQGLETGSETHQLIISSSQSDKERKLV